MPFSKLRRFNGPSRENKKCEKVNKYQDLARELKIVLNKKMTVIQIVVGAFIKVVKGREKRLGELEHS